MGLPPSKQITQLLVLGREGEQEALDQLIPLVYAELHRMAERYMRREVESLIEHERQAGSLIDSPVIGTTLRKEVGQDPLPDLTGHILSHYRVLEKIGEGGMGVVYRAEDTRLKRSVALKLLPPERLWDPERKRRFVKEARAASTLNHPNIVTIYDIGQAEGIDFIAMEYVAGGTAVEAEGTFGFPPTDDGMILGTVTYMSPEQAQGKKVDARSEQVCIQILGRSAPQTLLLDSGQ